MRELQAPCAHVCLQSPEAPALRQVAGRTDRIAAKPRYEERCRQTGQTRWQIQNPSPCRTISPEQVQAAVGAAHPDPGLRNRPTQQFLHGLAQLY